MKGDNLPTYCIEANNWKNVLKKNYNYFMISE